MKYIKDFKTWLNENYPSFDEPEEMPEGSNKELSTDIANLMFSYFDGGEMKFKSKLASFNEKYKTNLKHPTDWMTLSAIDDPEKIYLDVEEFANAYNEYVT